jgi:hypothetical protein
MEKERGEFSCKTFPVAILERQQGAAAWAQDCCSSPAPSAMSGLKFPGPWRGGCCGPDGRAANSWMAHVVVYVTAHGFIPC